MNPEMNVYQPNTESANESWRSMKEYPIKTKFIFVAGVMVMVCDAVKIVQHKFNLMTRKKLTDVWLDVQMDGRRTVHYEMCKLYRLIYSAKQKTLRD